MTWSSAEKIEIKDLKTANKEIASDVKDILTALVGNIKTKEPGLIGNVREMDVAVVANADAIRTNSKQHLWFLGSIILCVLGIAFGLLGGSIENLIEFLIRITS